MSNVVPFPVDHKRPWLIARRPCDPIYLSAEDIVFQQAIREQSAELRALRAAQRPKLAIPSFERFWSLFGGATDCGNLTGAPEYE